MIYRCRDSHYFGIFYLNGDKLGVSTSYLNIWQPLGCHFLLQIKFSFEIFFNWCKLSCLLLEQHNCKLVFLNNVSHTNLKYFGLEVSQIDKKVVCY